VTDLVRENWNHSARSRPARFVTPRTEAELLEIVRDAGTAAPVRAAGHWHSLNRCIEADGGTQLLLDRLADPPGRIAARVDRAAGTVTVQAGTSLRDVAKALLPDLQLPVTPEIGNATAGSVACCGTKDSSLRGGPGQVSSAVLGMRLVTPDGADPVTDAQDAERMRLLRSSYGLLGVVSEVTFRVEPVQVVAFEYEELGMDPLPALAALRGRADGFLAFLEPFRRRAVVERRSVEPGHGALTPADRIQCACRSFLWERLGSGAAASLWDNPLAELLRDHPIGHALSALGGRLFDKVLALGLLALNFRARRADTSIEFAADRPDYFDFTFWAFPASRWGAIVPRYLEFCEAFQRDTGFRPSLPTEIYSITRDDRAVLSFSLDEDVFTLDMVHHRRADRPFDPRWIEMNRRFNELAADLGGRPLLNQTKELDGAVATTVRERNPTLARGWELLRRHARPRFLSRYFQDLL
jgi:FAD/FMN-containing dehydrogenase